MNKLAHRLILLLAALPAAACAQTMNDDDVLEKARQLIAKESARGIPMLDWEDVPDLLALGGSTREIVDFPRSPYSSQYEERCSEGMVALWLVEGLRRGEPFASLNALCFAGPVEGDGWTAASEANHERVNRAYQEWWAQVRALPRDEAAMVDPLLRTGLHWH